MSSTIFDYSKHLQASKTPHLNNIESLGICLVTGAAGFPGRNIVKTLLA